MTNIKKVIISISIISFTLLFVLLSHSLLAQDYVDLVKLNYNNTSQNNFENSNAKTRVEELDLEVTLPIVLNNSTNLLTGLIYERIQTKLFEDESEETFSSISLKIGLNKTHSAKWSGTYMLLPKLASDFNHISNKDFQLGAVALLKYKKNENMLYKVGLYANSELFGPWFVPLLGLYYLSPNKKFEANLTLPISADINYAVHKNVAMGMNFYGQIRSYHLTKLSTTGNDGYVARSTNELFGYLKFNLTKSLNIQTKVGHSIGRYYRVYDEDDKISFGIPLHYFGDNRQQLNTDFKDGWVFQLMLVQRLYKNPK